MPHEKKNDDQGLATPQDSTGEGASSHLVDRYEDLRRQVLEGGPAVSGSLGLGLFLRQGMAAWMAAWRCCRPLGERRSPDTECFRDETSPPVQAELVAILATMAWHSIQETMR